MKLKLPEEYGYVVRNGICLFQKGPLSQWWGGFKGQSGSFKASEESPLYNCAEQFMMTAKAVLMDDMIAAEKIIAEKNPNKQKDLGREIKNFDSAKWDKFKFMVVYFGNYFKFSQNTDLRDFLLAFPDGTIFAEAAPWDKVWGIGLGPNDPRARNVETWEGTNLLGKAITEVHHVLHNDLDFVKHYEKLKRSRS